MRRRDLSIDESEIEADVVAHDRVVGEKGGEIPEDVAYRRCLSHLLVGQSGEGGDEPGEGAPRIHHPVEQGDGTSLAYAEGGDLNDPVAVGVQARGLAVHDDTVPEAPAEALPELVVRGAWVHEASL